MTVCTGCGHDDRVPAAHQPPTTAHCGNCPPSTCEYCGGVNTWSTGDLCGCWTSLAGLPLADIKGLLAEVGLSVDTHREAS